MKVGMALSPQSLESTQRKPRDGRPLGSVIFLIPKAEAPKDSISGLFSPRVRAHPESVLPSKASVTDQSLILQTPAADQKPSMLSALGLESPFLPPSTSGIKSEIRSVIQMLAVACQTSVLWKPGCRETYVCLSRHIWAAEPQGVRGPHP